MASSVCCSHVALKRLVYDIIMAMGADAQVSEEVSSHLVWANLSGHDSHGVLRVVQYVGQADAGEMAPSARPSILVDSGCTALIDGHLGFGHFMTAFALDWAIGRARTHGVAVAAIRHSTHIGCLGRYTRRAAEGGLIAILTAGLAGPYMGGMALFGSAKRFFGANPWSIAVPAKDRFPMVMDGSTSTIAEGKVRFARAKGTSVPSDCITDVEGNPTTNPEDFYAGGALVPMGAAVAGHKGYGLALASAMLGGLSMIDDPTPSMNATAIHQDVGDTRGRMAGVFLAIVDPARFGDPDHYQGMVDATMDAVKRMPPKAGVAELMVPGEPELRTRQERERNGIALPAATLEDLAMIAARFGVAMPRDIASAAAS